jgi:hypothetical protein
MLWSNIKGVTYEASVPGYISQLTTLCATPDLSVPGLPMDHGRSDTAPTSRIQTAMGVRRPPTGHPHFSSVAQLLIG